MFAVVAAAPRFFFRPENRVLDRPDFLSAYDSGKRFRRKSVQVFIQPRCTADLPTRLGVTVTRKVGNAVTRNRLKRWAREIFRTALPGLVPGFTIIINFHRTAVDMKFDEVRRDLHQVWRDAGLLPHDAGPTG